MNYQTLINELLENLLAQDGSDLHLGEERQPAIRINGQLIFLANYKPFDKAIRPFNPVALSSQGTASCI